jgi:hypothetical protein
VREAAAYEKKKNDFHRWWHGDADLAKVIAKGEKNDRTEETLRYLGPHPAVMAERIRLHGGLKGGQNRRVLVFGEPASYPDEFLARVDADLLFTHDERELRSFPPADVVALSHLGLLAKIKSFGRLKSHVPEAMGSPQARPWPKTFRALLQFSEKNIAVK